MTHSNLDIIQIFFEAYAKHGRDALRNVLAENVQWTFPGHHPASGTSSGIDEVVALFDRMGGAMGGSNVKAEKLIVGANDKYVVECQCHFH